jgi:hypothetical protein
MVVVVVVEDAVVVSLGTRNIVFWLLDYLLLHHGKI